ncbi:MAG: hypothetical protein WCX96_01385 [Bacilli bacterium]
MKKILILALTLILLPTVCFAKVNDNNSVNSNKDNRIIPGDTIKEKRDYIEEKIEEAQNNRKQIRAFVMTKAQIKVQTKEQIMTNLQEVKQLKTQLRTMFKGFSNFTKEEREELKDEITNVRTQIRDAHLTNVSLRVAAREKTLDIKESISEVIEEPEINEEKTIVIENILTDLKSL